MPKTRKLKQCQITGKLKQSLINKSMRKMLPNLHDGLNRILPPKFLLNNLIPKAIIIIIKINGNARYLPLPFHMFLGWRGE